jgi:signal transduction histidine kinase
VFENIIDNAVKYGNHARVSLERRGRMAVVRVRDGGPGIPDDSLQEVLRPFVRLEASRCRDTGGTGLGLAIVVNLLKVQQGSLTLRNHPDGGLEVSVQLPVAAVPK